MKTLIKNETKESAYIWNDEEVVIVKNDMVVEPYSLILDLNSSNAKLIENVTPPSDWKGCKYIYDADANPQWSISSLWNENETP